MSLSVRSGTGYKLVQAPSEEIEELAAAFAALAALRMSLRTS